MNTCRALRKTCLALCLIPSLTMAAENWEFIIAPYGLLPSIEGKASVGPVEGADIDVGGG